MKREKARDAACQAFLYNVLTLLPCGSSLGSCNRLPRSSAGIFIAHGPLGFAPLRCASLRFTAHGLQWRVASGHLKTSPQPPFAPPFRPEILYRYLLLREYFYLHSFLYAFSFLFLSFKIHNKHTIKVLHVNETQIYYINLSFDVIYFLSFT